VELGGYLGYSAILFADAMRRENPSSQDELKIWSLEMSTEFAEIARKLIELAGLSEIVTVVIGPAEESLRKLKGEGKLTGLDMLFLDHAEELYVTDFKVCEELRLLRKGAVVVADNVVRPGAPEYRELARGHPGLKSEGVRGLIQPGDLEVST
jgi:catechol O-methyltransferase